MGMVRAFQADSVLFGQAMPGMREFCLPTGVLVGLLALGVWALLWVKRWRQETAEDLTVKPEDLVDHYQRMVDDGLLDPEEFARIKDEADKLKSHSEPPESSPPKSI